MFTTRKLVEGTGLTADEVRIVRGLAMGKSSRELAHELRASRGAVAQRIYRLSIAMGCRTTTQTVVECLRRGWVQLDRPSGGD